MGRSAVRAVSGDRRAPSRGDQQRARIIAAVTALLDDVPIADLSVMQIAQRAGVTRPVFYFYFETKYAAVAAALEQVWNEFDTARNSVDVDALGQDPAAITRRLVSDADAVWRRHRGLLNACVLARSSDPQLDAMWRVFNDTQTRRILKLLSGLRDSARIRPVTADFEALIETLLGMTVWALLEDAGPDSADRRIASITAIWLATVWGG
jgi:TetR/AcrR family transcriptional regulator, ethionamide resistance regulator